MPAMGIYGRMDRIVNPKQGEVLAQYAPQADVRYFERSGHFPMMDEPEQFYSTLHEFLNHQ